MNSSVLLRPLLEYVTVGASHGQMLYVLRLYQKHERPCLGVAVTLATGSVCLPYLAPLQLLVRRMKECLLQLCVL